MHLELSEVFVCPACRPAQGLVVLVDDIVDRRVRRGHLGCPGCELRVPIREGVLRFDRAGGTDRAEGTGGPGGVEAGAGEDRTGVVDRTGAGAPPAAGPLADVGREEAAVRLAALLGTDHGEGTLLLGPGLAELAEPLAGVAPGCEVLALEAGPAGPAAKAAGPGTGTSATRGGGAPGDSDGSGVSRAVGLRPEALPIVTGRLAGAALLGPDAEAVREAIRALAEGGRLVLLEPSDRAREALKGEPMRIAASEPGATVAVREPGGARGRA